MPDNQKSLRLWQIRVFWLLWIAYASYYMCRLNISVAKPLMKAEFTGWTDADFGLILSVYQIAYAIGQLVNGQIGGRLGARRMITMAMLIAGLANLGFSQTTSYPLFLVFWGLNGLAQSAGWSLLVQTMANWTPIERRGTVIGLLSTCYQVGNVASWLLAGWLVSSWGWRAAFWVPGLYLLPVAAIFFLFVRNQPEDAGFPPVRVDVKTTSAPGTLAPATNPTALDIFKMTFTNRILWVLGIAFFCANSVRYTFMNWTPDYMTTFHHQDVMGGAFKSVALPLIGALGATSAGWISDRFFGKRRAPWSAVNLFGLAALCACFTLIPEGSGTIATIMLGLAGFLIYGPDMLMSGAATVDVSHPKAAAAATGFTMCLGALGAFFSGYGVGWLKDLSDGSWNLVFYVLAGLAFVPALLMVSIWNAKPKGA